MQWRISDNYESTLKNFHLKEVSWHTFEKFYSEDCSKNKTNGYYTISKIFDSGKATDFRTKQNIRRRDLFGVYTFFNVKKNKTELILTTSPSNEKDAYIPFLYTFKKEEGEMIKDYSNTCCMYPSCKCQIDICLKNYNKINGRFYCDECMTKEHCDESVNESTHIQSKKSYEYTDDRMIIPFDSDIIEKLSKLII